MIPLWEVKLVDSDNICSVYAQTFNHEMKGTGIKMYEVDRGVLFKRAGNPAVTVYKNKVARTIALEDYEVAKAEKAEAEAAAAEIKKYAELQAAEDARVKREAAEAAATLAREAKLKRDADRKVAVERAEAGGTEPLPPPPPAVPVASLAKDMKGMTDEEKRSLAAAEARANRGRK
jgi:hypothetical protein